MGRAVKVLVAPGATSTLDIAFVAVVAKVITGAVTVKVCVTSGGKVAVPVVPPPCDAVIVVVPVAIKWMLPFNIVATAVFELV